MSRHPYPVYGWSAVKLYENLSLAQLTELMQSISANPENANPAHARGNIHLYTKAARHQMDAVSWAITYHLKDKQAGGPNG